ncbi:large ribosomal subunit protein mL41 isoform X3 [Dermacentor andersoni]|uniref:large ribosomal subunit protein mL41 isoform X3 n=1 Tax=Dermacentor andersoni TaxID=34620 RepID=UPI003B3B985F
MPRRSFPNQSGAKPSLLACQRETHMAGTGGSAAHSYGVRWPSVSHRGPPIPEMVPELIVPDLTNCQLGPYVSYRAPEVCQGPFTARDLFDAVYSDAVAKDFKDGQADKSVRHLDEQPSPEDARVRARQTGSDIFPPLWRVRKMEDQ